MSWQHAAARRVSRFAGDDDRVAELRNHLDEVEAHGDSVGVADIGSVGVLVGRRAATRFVVDLPWLGVAALLTLPYLLLLGHSYETHFFAWDMANETSPVSASARSWSRAVDALTIVGLCAGFVAIRRALEHLRRGRTVGPIALCLGWLVAASQSDLFIERTPWVRDGRLQAGHIEEVPYYSVALYAAFVAIPVAFLIWDVLSRGRWSSVRAAPSTGAAPTQRLEPQAVAAVGSLVLVVFQPVFAPVMMLGFVWASNVFDRRLKLLATAAVLSPVAVLVGYAVATELDDPPPAFMVALAFTAAVWACLAYVAFRPILGGRFARTSR